MWHQKSWLIRLEQTVAPNQHTSGTPYYHFSPPSPNVVQWCRLQQSDFVVTVYSFEHLSCTVQGEHTLGQPNVKQNGSRNHQSLSGIRWTYIIFNLTYNNALILESQKADITFVKWHYYECRDSQRTAVCNMWIDPQLKLPPVMATWSKPSSIKNWKFVSSVRVTSTCELAVKASVLTLRMKQYYFQWGSPHQIEGRSFVLKHEKNDLTESRFTNAVQHRFWLYFLSQLKT